MTGWHCGRVSGGRRQRPDALAAQLVAGLCLDSVGKGAGLSRRERTSVSAVVTVTRTTHSLSVPSTTNPLTCVVSNWCATSSGTETRLAWNWTPHRTGHHTTATGCYALVRGPLVEIPGCTVLEQAQLDLLAWGAGAVPPGEVVATPLLQHQVAVEDGTDDTSTVPRIVAETDALSGLVPADTLLQFTKPLVTTQPCVPSGSLRFTHSRSPISSMELQIAYKLRLAADTGTTQGKDFEDALHLYPTFEDQFNREKLEAYVDQLGGEDHHAELRGS